MWCASRSISSLTWVIFCGTQRWPWNHTAPEASKVKSPTFSSPICVFTSCNIRSCCACNTCSSMVDSTMIRVYASINPAYQNKISINSYSVIKQLKVGGNNLAAQSISHHVGFTWHVLDIEVIILDQFQPSSLPQIEILRGENVFQTLMIDEGVIRLSRQVMSSGHFLGHWYSQYVSAALQ